MGPLGTYSWGILPMRRVLCAPLEGVKAWRKRAGVEKGGWGGGGFEPNGWFSLGLSYSSTYKMEGMILMTSFLEGLSE